LEGGAPDCRVSVMLVWGVEWIIGVILSEHPALHMGDYRKLKVWQRARAFSLRMRELVNALPARERLTIGEQLVRAADSVRFTIVEGAGFNNDRQLARYLSMALASANEVQDELDTLVETGLLPSEFADMPPELVEIRAMLAVFLRQVAGQTRPKRRKGQP
jgi:four helix bundle protein